MDIDGHFMYQPTQDEYEHAKKAGLENLNLFAGELAKIQVKHDYLMDIHLNGKKSKIPKIGRTIEEYRKKITILEKQISAVKKDLLENIKAYLGETENAEQKARFIYTQDLCEWAQKCSEESYQKFKRDPKNTQKELIWRYNDEQQFEALDAHARAKKAVANYSDTSHFKQKLGAQKSRSLRSETETSSEDTISNSSDDSDKSDSSYGH